MEARVSSVAIVVADQARSLQFFTEKVGFEKKADFTNAEGYRYLTVGPRGQDLEVVLWQTGSATHPAQAGLSKHWAPAKSPPTFLVVADCELLCAQLSSRGVEFVSPAERTPWGTVATFRDPDGNLFTITQPTGSWEKK